jgi:cobalt/nickel transport system ATP-binding protein
MDRVFDVEQASFRYPGAETCLEDITFSVRRGERVALAGANGSGKTTLLHILDGLLFPTCGRVLFMGKPLTEEALERGAFGAQFRKSVGLLFQNSDVQLFCPTVEEELAFGPLQTRMPREDISQRIEDTAELLGIGGLLARSPQQLSTGEKKSVALASLLTMAPSVLLLDEPTAGLDPRSQSRLVDLLEELNAAGLTLVFATHDLVLLPHLADRLIVVGEDHRIAADSDVAAILHDEALLESVNLIHEHRHRHGSLVHSHPHRHAAGHGHEHGDGGPGHVHDH